MEIDELVSESYLIMSKCMENFDPDRGVPFEVYFHETLKVALPEFVEKNLDWAETIHSRSI